MSHRRVSISKQGNWYTLGDAHAVLSRHRTLGSAMRALARLNMAILATRAHRVEQEFTDGPCKRFDCGLYTNNVSGYCDSHEKGRV